MLFYVNAPIYKVILFELTDNTPILQVGKLSKIYLHVVVLRSNQNTRLRDFLIYILAKLQYKNNKVELLKAVLDATSKKWGSTDIFRVC